jgi:hypothetical protein
VCGICKVRRAAAAAVSLQLFYCDVLLLLLLYRFICCTVLQLLLYRFICFTVASKMPKYSTIAAVYFTIAALFSYTHAS